MGGGGLLTVLVLTAPALSCLATWGYGGSCCSSHLPSLHQGCLPPLGIMPAAPLHPLCLLPAVRAAYPPSASCLLPPCPPSACCQGCLPTLCIMPAAPLPPLCLLPAVRAAYPPSASCLLPPCPPSACCLLSGLAGCG